MRGTLRTPLALCTLLATASLAAVAASPSQAATCGAGSYSYAGIGSRAVASGVVATIAPTSTPRVRDGHVAGWVGVGGIGEGPDGMDEWIQIGLTAKPQDTTSRIYYEIARPLRKPVYVELRHPVRTGEQHLFAVLELESRQGWWQVSLDGSPVGKPVFLAQSHANWSAQAVGESAGGGTSGACNLYSYAFKSVSFAHARDSVWSPFLNFELFQDPFYRLVRTSRSSFLAQSIATAPRTPVSTP